MPESTPVFAIPYPCSGENIDCGMFGDFTEAIQNALTTVDALQAEVLNRDAVKVSTTATSPAAGVLTNVSWATEDYDTNTMFDPAGDTTAITIRTAGWYLATTGMTAIGAGTTSTAVAITQNAVVRYRHKYPVTPATLAAECQVIGLIQCAVADVLRVAVLGTGAGNTVLSESYFSVSLIVPT